MKSTLLFLFLVTVSANAANLSSTPDDRPGSIKLCAEDAGLLVRPQSPQEAYEYLLSTLSQMDFFIANNYKVALPDHPSFTTQDKIGTFETFHDEVYRAEDFQHALRQLRDNKLVLQEALEWFSSVKDVGTLYVPDQYTVALTLYGPGGSYDPDSGTITLFTTTDGNFKGGGGTHTLVHEMMHIAIEESLIRPFNLSHWEKERVVDVLTQRELGDLLPGYQLQPQGIAEIGEVLANEPLSRLVQAMKAYRKR